MARVLLLLALPDKVRRQYRDAIAAACPDIDIMLLTHAREATPQVCADAEVLITFGPHLEDRAAAVFAAAPRLRWVQALGTGTDNILDQPTLGGGVIVTNVHGIHGAACSEAAIMAMLALARDLPRIVRNQDEKRWDRWPAQLLAGQTVGLIGVGAIAADLAPRCRALGMRVIGVSATPRAIDGFDRIFARESLIAAVREMDHVVLLVPYATDTHHLIDAKILAAMKPSACLVNLARGGIVDESALIAALSSGAIRGAALDVFDSEPLPQNSPLWTMPNVLITPHLAGFYDRYAEEALAVVIENMRAFLAGHAARMRNVVRAGKST